MVFENYYLYAIALWLVTRLPRGLVYYVAGMIAELNFYFNHRSRRGVYANQARVLPPGIAAYRRWRIAARCSATSRTRSSTSFTCRWSSGRTSTGTWQRFKGFEHVQAALANGKGGIFVTVHMGSWELGGACMGLQGVPLTAAALPHKDPRIDAIFLSNREAANMEVVPLGGAMPKLEDALSRGRFIALVSDRDVRGRGPILPFFGAATHVPDGHARLALRTGAWILPVTTYRTRDMRIVLDVREPIIADPERDTVAGLTARTLIVLEDFIRGHPEQWLSFFNLWSETELPVA